jgi:ribonucleoside-triphosphate reductase (formate)
MSSSPSISTANTRLVEEYLTKASWKTAENSNSTFSHQGLMQYISNHVISEYWLNQIYTPQIRQYAQENRFHIHDLGFLSAYCSGWSIEDILLGGFGGVDNKIQCRPPKHLNTALNQCVNFLFTLQGELAGAQALSNFDTYLAPFVRQDRLTYVEVFKYIQSFVYSLNVPTRSGFQAPFTNISMDLLCPKNMAGHGVIIGGKMHDTWTYSDFQEEMDMINRAFTEVMVQGDGNGNIFSFPIPTYNLSDGFDFESPRYECIWAMTAKYGVPYFANFINSDLNPDDFRSMCCRLRLDTSQLHCRAGGLFGATPLTGSLGVVTLNMPNLAIRSQKSGESFFDLVKDALNVARDSLEIKRKVVNDQPQLYPYAAHYLSVINQRTGSFWTNHFSTIGVNGMHEAMEIMFGEGIAEQHDFALEVLNFIKDILQEFQDETGNLYNLEATPAESTCYKLAQKDHKLFPEYKLPAYYTNSTKLPVNYTDDLFEALDHQEALDCAYTGGTVFHAFLGERLPDWRQARDLVKSIATRYRIPYISLTPTFSICRSHGYIAGECHECAKCHEECLVYTRIVGYYRPTKDWNKGKKQEYIERETYKTTVSAGLMTPPLSETKTDADVDVDEDGKAMASLSLRNGLSTPPPDELEEALDLPVAGYTKNTYSDYPGKIASIMFTSRCNLACSWCHNGPVVRGQRDGITASDVLEHISKSRNRNLVVSGGEPTIHASLIPFLRVLRARGISVKLDTNGTNPDVLRRVLAEGLVDFVAMDIKCALDRYRQVAGKAVDPAVLEETIEMIKASGVPYQFRTTVVPGLVDIEDLMEAKALAGSSKLAVQRFRKGETNLHRRFRDMQEQTPEEFQEMVDEVFEPDEVQIMS